MGELTESGELTEFSEFAELTEFFWFCVVPSMNKVRLFSYFIISILALTGILFAQNDDDVINVDSSIVVMNATITDLAGKPVRGLQQNQFKIFEDGKEQEIAFFQAEETPFAAVILLDSSGSMEQRMTLARSAAIRFLDGLRPNDVAAIYNFDSKVSLVQEFSNSQ
nr:VWFA-related Acidobacterial domain [uncultured bacterium]